MKFIYLVIGVLCLGLGTLGIALPILPTTPFFLVSAFCFAKSSARLHKWFLSTALYHNHLEGFVEKRTMPLKTKVMIMVSVTIMLAVGFIMMNGITAGQIVLIVIWFFHIFYFFFRVKTAKL